MSWVGITIATVKDEEGNDGIWEEEVRSLVASDSRVNRNAARMQSLYRAVQFNGWVKERAKSMCHEQEVHCCEHRIRWDDGR